MDHTFQMPYCSAAGKTCMNADVFLSGRKQQKMGGSVGIHSEPPTIGLRSLLKVCVQPQQFGSSPGFSSVSSDFHSPLVGCSSAQWGLRGERSLSHDTNSIITAWGTFLQLSSFLTVLAEDKNNQEQFLNFIRFSFQQDSVFLMEKFVTWDLCPMNLAGRLT